MSEKQRSGFNGRQPESAGPDSPLSLYVHLPFCIRKCFYCDFNSGPANDLQREDYLNALSREILASPWRGRQARTLFFGGGTPSELSLEQLARIRRDLERAFDLADCVETTIECNPGTVDSAYFEGLLGLGFDRISLGLQSFDDAHLMGLGRIHTAAEARRGVQAARRAGVGNLNVDLIFGLHGQTVSEWADDLEQALALQPEHLSLYALTIEPGTDFGRRQAAGLLPVIGDDAVADMFELNRVRAAAAGYRHYEISNFARPGSESRHNLAYWRNEDSLGFGVSAASYVGGRRWSNSANWDRYCAAPAGAVPIHGEEELEGLAAAGEAAMLAIRTSDGISTGLLSARYGVDFEAVFSDQLELLEQHRLVRRSDDRVRLTEAGQLLASEVGMRFLA